MTVYIDIKRHVCARVVIVFSQVIKDNNIKAARALRIQVQVFITPQTKLLESYWIDLGHMTL